MKHITISIAIFLLVVPSSFSQKGVVLNVLDRTKGESRISFFQRSKVAIPEYYEDKKLGRKEAITDSTFKIVFERCDKVQALTCNWLYDNKTIVITPNDNLNVVIDYSDNEKKRFQVTFIGKNDINYSFNTSSQQDLINLKIRSQIKSAGSLKGSLFLLDSIYTSNIHSLQLLPSSLFNQVRINVERANFFYDLYYAVKYHNEDLENSDVLKLMDKIFSREIVCPLSLLMNIPKYTAGIYYMNKLLCNKIKSESVLMSSTDSINKYFGGELRDYLLSMNFSRVYFDNQKENIKDPNVEKWFNLYNNKIKDPSYNRFINYTYKKYKQLNTLIPSVVLNENLISLNDSSTITIGELLNKYKGKPILIENWATWCGACINEIKIGKTNVKKMEQKGVEFIYISLDNMQDFNKAREVADNLGIRSKSFVLPNNFKTEYLKYFNISNIPRFIMMDANLNIKNQYAFRPSQISNIEIYPK